MSKINRKEIRRRIHARIRKKVVGTTLRPRLAIHYSNQHVYAQVIDDSIGCTLVAASTLDKELENASSNIASAQKVGSLINNMIIGVSKGFVKDLEIQGVGLRAAVKGSEIDLSLGRSHPLLHPIPAGLTVTVTDNTKIKVEGIDKQLVGQFAAEVRGYYPPEPYKGKGVRYVGEYVRRKEGKSVGK